MLYSRYRYIYRPTVGADLCALLPQLGVLYALIEPIEEFHHIPPFHDILKVGLPCAVELIHDLSPQVVQHVGSVLRSSGKA